MKTVQTIVKVLIFSPPHPLPSFLLQIFSSHPSKLLMPNAMPNKHSPYPQFFLPMINQTHLLPPSSSSFLMCGLSPSTKTVETHDRLHFPVIYLSTHLPCPIMKNHSSTIPQTFSLFSFSLLLHITLNLTQSHT